MKSPTRNDMKAAGAQGRNKVKGWQLGPKEGLMTAIGGRDLRTDMGFVNGPTDESTWEIGRTGSKSDTGNIV